MMSILTGWGELSVAFAAFFASHVVPARPSVRRVLHAHLGGATYAAAYSAVSLAILAWLIAAAGNAPHIQLWDFELWQPWVPNLVMPFVCLLIAFGFAAPNPFSISLWPGKDASFDSARPGIAGITRHPLLWAITLWAAAHAVPNGDLAHVLLFGLFALFGFAGIAAIDRRRRAGWGGKLWAERAQKTSLVPFAAVIAGRVRLGELNLNPLRGFAGLALYIMLIAAHPHLIGVSPLPQ